MNNIIDSNLEITLDMIELSREFEEESQEQDAIPGEIICITLVVLLVCVAITLTIKR